MLAAAAVAFLIAGDPNPLPPAPAPDRVRLTSGESLRGEVLAEGTSHATVRLEDGRVVLLESARLAKVERAARRTGPLRTVRLRSGRSLSGQLLSQRDGVVEIRLASGTLVSLSASDVASVESER
jgi:hypothetical protein